jgi:hypothetical protein
VRLHYPANAMLAGAIQKLCEELTATETVFPTTKLRLVYQLVGGARAADAPLQPGEATQSKQESNH